MKTSVSTLFKWITGGLEAFWGIPIIGGTIILGFAWLPLLVMLILHIVTLIFSIQEKKSFHGSIIGIVTSCLGWIIFLGMIMHIISAILLLMDAYKNQKEQKEVVTEI
ncbi:hypothetical protein F9U64_02505 [Gracilibacillus oryzae]|uniref:Uncharacterized protein n=1 Tax=Gracilibacillus oryzae TaxID=1672701 RepID=A0A7C8KU49_9BACI|nr:hypothetical protein [Gracilibacillus oryzae]KAB8138992.1 hypothetical protein F9U64_02505 [Gracilibacillus oryzae]